MTLRRNHRQAYAVTTTAEPSFDSLISTAHELAEKSAEVISPYFRQLTAVDDKSGGQLSSGPFDPVTAADRDAEAAIRAHLRAVYPEHGIVGE
ncbi:MAG: inositol monophosphatase family protein, partial [Pseudomonadota bacterium]